MSTWRPAARPRPVARAQMAYKCNKCLYITKSYFFMKNHARRFHGVTPREPFDCSKSDPETFYCIDCKFKTASSVVFNNHIKIYKMQNGVKKEEPQVPEPAPEQMPVM